MGLDLSYPIILLSLLTSFLISLSLIPQWIKKAKKCGFVGADINKPSKPKVAEIGGLIVSLAFLVGMFVYIAIDTFYLSTDNVNQGLLKELYLFASLLTITLMTLIGLIDDISGWKIGLKQWQKPLLTLIAAIPVAVIKFGDPTFYIPFYGMVNLGLFFYFVIVPIAIMGAANGFNMLAGYNGLEAGMGIIILSTLSWLSWIHGQGYLAVLGLTMVCALMGFYIYNRYPSKIFPGDSLTYPVGATIAIIAILANLKRVALILFIPYFIELVLKARGRFRKESFAKVLPNRMLMPPYKKIYGLEHLIIKILNKVFHKTYELDVVYSIFFLELFLVCIVLIFL